MPSFVVNLFAYLFNNTWEIFNYPANIYEIRHF